MLSKKLIYNLKFTYNLKLPGFIKFKQMLNIEKINR
jgi:hypothetical protein